MPYLFVWRWWLAKESPTSLWSAWETTMLSLGAPNVCAVLNFWLDNPTNPTCWSHLDNGGHQATGKNSSHLFHLSNIGQRSQDALICAETSAWLACVSSNISQRSQDALICAKTSAWLACVSSNIGQRSQDALICAETSAWLACVSSCLNHSEPTLFGLTKCVRSAYLSPSHFSESHCDQDHGNSHGQGVLKLFSNAQALHLCRENRGASSAS